MASDRRTLRRLLTVVQLLLIGLMILQALGYGIGFFLDPASGVGEFASPPPDVVDDLTVALVGLVGVAMLGTAVALSLAVFLVVRGVGAGHLLAAAVGLVYVLAGVSALRSGWAWDARFYAGTGGLLALLSMASLLLAMPDRNPDP